MGEQKGAFWLTCLDLATVHFVRRSRALPGGLSCRFVPRTGPAMGVPEGKPPTPVSHRRPLRLFASAPARSRSVSAARSQVDLQRASEFARPPSGRPGTRLDVVAGVQAPGADEGLNVQPSILPHDPPCRAASDSLAAARPRGMISSGWGNIAVSIRPSSRRKTRHVAQRLRKLAASIAARNSQTEDHFLNLGRCLRELHAGATALATEVTSSVRTLHGVLTGTAVGGQNGVAAAALQQNRTDLESINHGEECLREIGAELLRLDRSMQSITRLVAILRTSVIGFAVESTRTPECQQAFAAFVEELRTLGSRTARTIETVSSHLNATLSSYAQDMNALHRGLQQLGALTEPIEQSARNAADAMQRVMDSSSHALTHLETLAATLAHASGEAVVHMQLGDIVRQKSEHVVQALESAAAALESAGRVQRHCALASVAHVLEIQRAQLTAINGEVQEGNRQLDRAFQSISGTCDEMVAVLDTCSAVTQTTSGSEGRRSLAQELESLDELADRGRDIKEQAHALAQRVAGATGTVSSHIAEIRTINREMHLQALNAIIKTAPLGSSGATLEVLSKEVDRMHRESSRDLATIVEGLERVALLGKTSTAGREDTAARRCEVVEAITPVAQAFTQIGNAAEAARLQLAGPREALATGRAGLAFLDTLTSDIGHGLRELGELSRACGQVHGQVDTVLTAELAGRYTMRSEREVLSRLAGVQRAPPAQTDSSAGQEEWFDHPSAAPPEGGASAQVVAECTESKETSAGPLPAGRSQAHDLGDNVDLF